MEELLDVKPCPLLLQALCTPSQSQPADEMSQLLRLVRPCSVVLDREEVSRYLARQKQRRGGKPLCEICHYPCADSTSLRRHMATMHGTEPICKYCRRFFNSVEEVEDHMLECVSLRNNLHRRVCNLCQEDCINVYRLRKHQASLHRMEPFCANCDKYFKSFVQLDNHKCSSDSVVPVTEKITSQVECDICGAKISRMQALRHHMARMHRAEPYCKHCKRFFQSYPEMERHLRGCATFLKIISVKGIWVETAISDLVGPPASDVGPSVASIAGPSKVSRARSSVVSVASVAGPSKVNRARSSVAGPSVLTVLRSTSPVTYPPQKPMIQCDVCEQKFSTITSLRNHNAAIHDMEPYCKKCRKKFPSYDHMRDHICNSLAKFCELCNKMFCNIRKHSAAIHNTEPFCKKCERIFNTEYDLEEHTKLCKLSMVCNICDIKMAKKYLMRQHFEEKHASDAFCNVCCSVFSDASLLKMHELAFHGQAPRLQDVHCNVQSLIENKIVASFLSEPQESFQTSTFVNSLNVEPALEDVRPKKKGHSQCDICLTEFTERGSLVRHMRSRHALSTMSATSCPVCQVEVVSQLALQRHMRAKHHLSACAVCHKRFISEQDLQRHMTRDHRSSRPRCDFCNKTFALKRYLGRHIKLKHQDELCCETCNLRFGTYQQVTAHRADCKAVITKAPVMYQDDDSVTCLECNINFRSAFNLRRHMAGFHKTEPFCVPCQTFFSSEAELESHGPSCGRPEERDYEYVMVDVAAPRLETEQRLNCEYCHLTFATRKTLRMHVKKQHNKGQVKFCTFCWGEFETVQLLISHSKSCKLNPKTSRNLLPSEASPPHDDSYELELLNPEFESVTTDMRPVEKIEPELERLESSVEEMEISEPAVEHVKTESFESTEQVESRHKCTLCDKSFPSSLDLKIHLNDVHDGVHLLCQQCRIEFRTIPEFVAHIHICSKSRPPSLPVIEQVLHIKEESFNSM